MKITVFDNNKIDYLLTTPLPHNEEHLWFGEWKDFRDVENLEFLFSNGDYQYLISANNYNHCTSKYPCYGNYNNCKCDIRYGCINNYRPSSEKFFITNGV